MNILIITTYYPPDSAIAAVRPYMFAKYLSRFGHKVTVLRSGEINGRADHFFSPLEGVRVISYLGEDSPAEIFARGGEVPYKPVKSRISFLPQAIRIPVAKVYHACMKPVSFLRWIRCSKTRFAMQKDALNVLRGEHFDIVFATYGELENVWAGAYAAELFGCKWIMDLRDPIASSFSYRGILLAILKRIQDRALAQADACTIDAEGARETSPGLRDADNVTVLYNGYEELPDDRSQPTPPQDVFSICYTGQLYGGSRSATALFKALQHLSDKGKIDLDRVRLEYAGPHFEFLRFEAAALHMERCLIDHGYTTRAEAARLQSASDIFLLLAWNKKGQLGQLTGKFYEGIRAGKPILAIVAGDVPNSELYQIDQRFHYGFCYEESRDAELFPQLCDFLLQAYTQKMERGAVDYAPSEELSTHFRYDTLTRQLEAICQRLVYGEALENDLS